MNYVSALSHAAKLYAGMPDARFIIDTGRNGVANERSDCSNWCNIRGAGIGSRPTTSTNSSLVDAFLW